MDTDTSRRAPIAPPANKRGERKLDQWLRRSLSDAHDEVLCECLPQSWIALIDKKLPRA